MTYKQDDLLKETLDKFSIIANKVIHSYSNLSEANIQLLDYSENATFLVQHEALGEKYILRVNRPNYHTKAEIESELAWLCSLDKYSPIQVSLPILDDSGSFIQTSEWKGEIYYSTLFTFLEGNSPNENNESGLIKQFEALGEITAKFHDYSIAQHDVFHTFNRMTWDYETILGNTPKWGKWQDGLAITSERAELFQRVSNTIKNRLERYGKAPDRFGLIHSDLRLANLIVEDEQIKVIDFDDCGFGWYMYDLATSLSFIEHKQYVPDLIESWLKGYRKVRPITFEEVDELPTFIMMRRLQLISWIGSRDNDTTRSLGSGYTIETDLLAKDYLEKYE